MSLSLLSSLLVVVAIYNAFDCETIGAIATDDVTAATDIDATDVDVDADATAGTDAGIDGKVQSSSDGLSSLFNGMFDNAKDDDDGCCF